MDTKETLGVNYRPRIVDRQLPELLSIAGAVLIEGPRACGKTMTGVNAANSAIFLDTPQASLMRETSPELLLEGQVPHLIDEWQLFPEIWNQVRRAVDKTPGRGHFILTGSSTPEDDVTRHTGAGRFMRLRMRSETWAEKGFSKGGVTLGDLFNKADLKPSRNTPSLGEVLEPLAHSGFPALDDLPPNKSLQMMTSYSEQIARTDLQNIADIRHRPETLTHLMAAIARSLAGDVSLRTLAKDMAPVAPDITADTVGRYLELLQRLFVVEAIPPWTGKLRSAARLRRSPKYHLADPALAMALLKTNPQKLRKDLETAGLLFESAVVHDLAVYVEAWGGRIYHYRDSNGNEIDAVLELPDGRWAGVEIKLGGGVATRAAQNLERVAAIIDAPPPSFLAVITGTGMSVTLKNGVHTFPLAALGY